ncbi:MAG: dTDP-4-dehydrorhamnose reductase [Oceanicaulis sp.]
MSGTLLILGRSGQLARALETAAGDGSWERVVTAGRSEADLSTPGAVRALIEKTEPGVVINAAAYTAVDKAESEPDAAFAVNADGAGEAAAAATEAGARFIHVSTDYVFSRNGPHGEYAQPDPVNVYGRSKLEGERRVLEACPRAAIVRTAGVFSGRGSDFPSAMWRLACENAPIRVVTDQRVSPTPADDLAVRLLALAEKGGSGVFHCAGAKGRSWYKIAEAALAALAKAGGPEREIEPISSDDMPRPAQRPSDSRLSSMRLEEATGLPAPDWKAGLDRAVKVWLSA